MNTGVARDARRPLSCSRCRSLRLTCDRKEPCIECLKRDVGHLCTKIKSRTRTKWAKTRHQQGADAYILSDGSMNTPSDVEDTASALGRLVEETSLEDAHLFMDTNHQVPTTAPDSDNSYWSDVDGLHRRNEQFALIRAILDAMPEPDLIRHLFEVFTTRCQGPLLNVVHTPTFLEQAQRLCCCLSCGWDQEQQVMMLSSNISMDTLACQLLALVLALAFHPTPTILGWSPSDVSLQALQLRASGSPVRTWRSLGLRCLQGKVSLFCGSIAALQAAIMLLLDGQEESLALDAILVTAISGAQKLGLNRLSDAKLEGAATLGSSIDDSSSPYQCLPIVRTEIGVRIWWALVMRDWSRANAVGYYSIHPSHFNTRRPLHINDSDLCPPTLIAYNDGHIAERPRSEFTTMSYSVYAIEVATFARESMDLRDPPRPVVQREQISGNAQPRDYLVTRYEDFLANLPSYFRPGSTIGLRSSGLEAAIPVHRWMLHQQLWTIFLRLNHASPMSPDNLATSRILAHNIINTQSQMQACCVACGSLSSNERQVLNAAIALLVDFLFSTKVQDARAPMARLNRLMTRDKVGEAIWLLREQTQAQGYLLDNQDQENQDKTSAQRSVGILEALLNLEEDEHSSDRPRINANVPPSLKQKIVSTLKRFQRNNQTAPQTATGQTSRRTPQTPDASMSPPVDDHEPKDLDVLPMISSDTGHDFWQFLDSHPLSLSSGDDLSFGAAT